MPKKLSQPVFLIAIEISDLRVKTLRKLKNLKQKTAMNSNFYVAAYAEELQKTCSIQLFQNCGQRFPQWLFEGCKSEFSLKD